MTTEWQRRKAERKAVREVEEHALKHQQIKRFDKRVREMVLTLVNDHGIEFRVQHDGQHIMLYSGAQGERPCKVSASVLPRTTMASLRRWVEQNFPEINL